MTHLAARPYPLRSGGHDALLLVDYAKGFFHEENEQEIRTLIGNALCPVIVSPHPRSPKGIWRGALLATMNQAEWDEIGDVGATWTAVTRGAEGVTLYRGIQWAGEYATEPVTNPQVVGAGDAFMAYCAVALAKGEAVPEAVWGANRYATQYVRQAR